MRVTRKNIEQVKQWIKESDAPSFRVFNNAGTWDFVVDKEELLNMLRCYYNFDIVESHE